jgi:AraC-like DNA-binding protein
MKSIPVDQLHNKTSTGLQIKVFKAGDDRHHDGERNIIHRDDHYIFFLLTNGSGTLKVDAQDIFLPAGHLYYVLPSQIHSKIAAAGAEGWFLAVDTSLIAPDFKEIFEHRLNLQLPCKLTDYELTQYQTLLGLLQIEFIKREGEKFYLSIIHSLVHTFLGMAASAYDSSETIEHKHTRSAELARQFKNLLSIHIHTIKSPSAYAALLNVSTGYLNEAIKKVTGSPVSYWIQQEIVSDAKRLLYYSDMDIKEIAHQLGYSDYSYFIRSFRKAMGMSPLKFRSLNRT